MTVNAHTLSNRLELTPPDTRIMESARQNIYDHVMSLQLDFLPVMKEKLQPLQRALSHAEALWGEHLAAIVAQLRSVNLAPIDLKQQQIEAHPDLSDLQKQLAIRMLNVERTRQLTGLTAIILKAANAIAESSDRMQQINLKLDGSRVQSTLHKHVDRLTQRKTDLDIRMSVIAEDRRLLDETIKAYEKYNLADIFKDLLPSAEELALINVPSPEIALLQAGIARLGKLLGKISDAINYSELTGERDKLRQRYNTLLDDSRANTQEIKATLFKLEELTLLSQVEQSKEAWVQEVRHVYRSLYRFLDKSAQQNDSTVSASEHVAQLKTYLKSFHDINRTL
ncbi:alpha-xenorhabdolysin family binary toxin subunit B [Pseudomonas sp. SZ57]|uniref:alpha-xenorhabdolysin family binary toxin subunit B n=1 Tax=Pseudomonas sp. SZ57 TaxID=2662259 RepID=UPI0035322CB2